MPKRLEENVKSTVKLHLTLFRVICYLCALYFSLMGIALIAVPHLITRVAGDQNPIIVGMLRGAGGSVIPYSLLYLFVARRPYSCLWALYVIAIANLIAIALDLTSVYLGEYALRHAMLDIPVEALSLLAMVTFILGRKDSQVGLRNAT
jgi:hypothetical protein